MAWFKVDDKLHSSRKLLKIPRRYRLAALGLWTIAGSWSADQLTDGHIPEYMVEEWGGNEKLIEWLIKADLWLKVPDGNTFKNWGEYQPTKADVEADREKNREKLRKWRERNRDSNEGVTGLQEGSKPVSNPAPVPSRPDPNTSSPKTATDRKTKAPTSMDVTPEMRAWASENGVGVDLTQETAQFLDYHASKGSTFVDWKRAWQTWMRNSKKFGSPSAPTHSQNGELNPDAILGRDYWVVGMPPEGLSIQEEIAWKRARRAEHEAERLEEARKKVANG